ncbi:protein MODIFIER OF SNC1 11-like isoform X2 [Salvia splendens]|uniref:protein MODIFIER OF SNC1 11-like isoform X2 n=1 Tax=Salvia splendens TaxID=180675 RepID=UPI001C280C7A|nr:protein MODIFIER OF SNC1 11-like isoform X2 [Salvia splendens]
MATATVSKVENPKTTTDLNLAPSPVEDALSTQQLSELPGDQTKATPDAAAAKTSDVDGCDAATDIQKKMKRAERFGMPVNLSEEEKRNSRAERFGKASGADGLDSSKQSEDLKRKARAERFGITKPVSAVSADEEAKKKARLARFGSTPVTDLAEEDKKKARALRFSQPQSSPKANGEGNIEKTAISGKAVGGT